MRTIRTAVLAACCCIALAALPVAAEEVAPASGQQLASVAPAGCATIVPGIPDPLQTSPCTVTVTCADESTVSCSGNSSCSTSGTNGRCVTCDGVQQGCCPLTACEQCEQNYSSCISQCEWDFECQFCENVYNRCITRYNCY